MYSKPMEIITKTIILDIAFIPDVPNFLTIKKAAPNERINNFISLFLQRKLLFLLSSETKY
jgi:hypothetical protein